MAEFTVIGSLTLSDVVFYIRAATLEGALARVAQGDFDTYDLDPAQFHDAHFAAATIEEIH